MFLKEEQIVDGSCYKQLGRNSKSYVLNKMSMKDITNNKVGA
jgi:hypothetical protein